MVLVTLGAPHKGFVIPSASHPVSCSSGSGGAKASFIEEIQTAPKSGVGCSMRVEAMGPRASDARTLARSKSSNATAANARARVTAPH